MGCAIFKSNSSKYQTSLYIWVQISYLTQNKALEIQHTLENNEHGGSNIWFQEDIKSQSTFCDILLVFVISMILLTTRLFIHTDSMLLSCALMMLVKLRKEKASYLQSWLTKNPL